MRPSVTRPFLNSPFWQKYLPWGALAAAVLAGAALRYGCMDALSPRMFSYVMESCFRFRYAEMRMRGLEPPALEPAAQWPEGFRSDLMILPLPDKIAAAYYRVGGYTDTYAAARGTINLFSALAVVAFAALALAVLRRPWPAAAAALAYALTAAACARSWGNFLQEDFAMPGLLLATAGVVYLLGAEKETRARWAAAAATALATTWAGSSWHMSQFYVTLLAAAVIAYALAGRTRPAALAGLALWLGLAAAAGLNKPLWAKGALWNTSAALALAPALGYGLARLLRREGRARWFIAGAAAALAAAALLFGRSADYGHVYALIAAKVVHFGRRPDAAALSPDARLFWTGPYNSPRPATIWLEYGAVLLPAAAGLFFWWRDALKEKRAGAYFAAAAALAAFALYLLMSRLTIFFAPWVAILAVYLAARRIRTGARLALAAALLAAWGAHAFVSYDAYFKPTPFRPMAERVFPPATEISYYYGTERDRLLLWFQTEARPGAVLTDFALSATFLYPGGRPTVLHPMFEVPEIRAKTLAYGAAAEGSEETFYRQCRAWDAAYVIYFAPQVLSTAPGSFYTLTGKPVPEGSAAWRMQFQPERLRRFRLVYESYVARVYEVGTPYDGFRAVAYHPLYDAAMFPAAPADADLLAFYRELVRVANWYQMGVRAQAGGDYVAAAAAFNTALLSHPDFEDASYRLGLCLLATGQYRDALAPLARAVTADPGSPDARRALADTQALLAGGVR